MQAVALAKQDCVLFFSLRLSSGFGEEKLSSLQVLNGVELGVPADFHNSLQESGGRLENAKNGIPFLLG